MLKVLIKILPLISLNKCLLTEVLKNHPTATIKEVSVMVGLGTTRVGEIINELKNMDKVYRIGGRKGGYWDIKN